MTPDERRQDVEQKLENARFMQIMETEVFTIKGWSNERKEAAKSSLTKWDERVKDLESMLK